MGFGVISSQGIRQLYNDDIITSEELIDLRVGGQVQPSTLDLRISDECFKVDASVLDEPNIHRYLKRYGKKLSFSRKRRFEHNQMYVFRLLEGVNLPKNISGRANPKSTTGRNDVFTQMITDNAHGFDSIRKGYSGPLYVFVQPNSFSIEMKPGHSLNQVRFYDLDERRLTTNNLLDLHAVDPIVMNDKGEPGSIDRLLDDKQKDGFFVTLDLSEDIIAYTPRDDAPTVDLSLKDHYPVDTVWHTLHKSKDKRLHLAKNKFYILATKDRLRVPHGFASEVVDFHSSFGDFRCHYAGLIDPGFGYADGSVLGTPIVLEMRAHTTNISVKDGRMICKLVFEEMREIPDIIYGVHVGSYSKQGLRLAKQFKQLEP